MHEINDFVSKEEASHSPYDYMYDNDSKSVGESDYPLPLSQPSESLQSLHMQDTSLFSIISTILSPIEEAQCLLVYIFLPGVQNASAVTQSIRLFAYSYYVNYDTSGNPGHSLSLEFESLLEPELYSFNLQSNFKKSKCHPSANSTMGVQQV